MALEQGYGTQSVDDARPDAAGERPDILILSKVYPAPIIAKLEERFTVHRHGHQDPWPEGLAERVRAVATDPGVGASEAVIGRLPKLELIACYGVGVDAIHLETARTRGVAVSNTPGLLTEDVADLALGLLLASARHIVTSDRYVREGRWTTLVAGVPLGRTLKGKTVGIVGLGRIGSAIASRATAFDMQVLYHGPRQKSGVPYPYMADLVEMARRSEFLIVACRGGPETRGLVSAEVIDALGPKGTLVNVARGTVVDEPALVDALTAGRLGFAALDVFADEPRVPESLLAMPNVVVMPHQGSATLETRLAMGQLVVDNLVAHFDNRPLPTPVIT